METWQRKKRQIRRFFAKHLIKESSRYTPIYWRCACAPTLVYIIGVSNAHL